MDQIQAQYTPIIDEQLCRAEKYLLLIEKRGGEAAISAVFYLTNLQRIYDVQAASDYEKKRIYSLPPSKLLGRFELLGRDIEGTCEERLGKIREWEENIAKARKDAEKNWLAYTICLAREAQRYSLMGIGSLLGGLGARAFFSSQLVHECGKVAGALLGSMGMYHGGTAGLFSLGCFVACHALAAKIPVCDDERAKVLLFGSLAQSHLAVSFARALLEGGITGNSHLIFQAAGAAAGAEISTSLGRYIIGTPNSLSEHEQILMIAFSLLGHFEGGRVAHRLVYREQLAQLLREYSPELQVADSVRIEFPDGWYSWEFWNNFDEEWITVSWTVNGGQFQGECLAANGEVYCLDTTQLPLPEPTLPNSRHKLPRRSVKSLIVP